MPSYLQPVEIPERCFLGEVLLWLAFQRLPIASYIDGEEVHASTEAGGMEIEVADWIISDDETKRAGIPIDPDWTALIEDKPTQPPEFYDRMIASYDPTPEEKIRLLEERDQAASLQQEQNAWKGLNQSFTANTSRSTSSSDIGQQCAIGADELSLRSEEPPRRLVR